MISLKTKEILKDIYILRDKKIRNNKEKSYPRNGADIARKYGILRQRIWALGKMYSQEEIEKTITA